MRRNRNDFTELEKMESFELEEAIDEAKKEYADFQTFITLTEMELLTQFMNKEITYADYQAGLPKVETVCNTLNNLEQYIRKAENILHGYEAVRFKTKKRNVVQTDEGILCVTRKTNLKRGVQRKRGL